MHTAHKKASEKAHRVESLPIKRVADPNKRSGFAEAIWRNYHWSELGDFPILADFPDLKKPLPTEKIKRREKGRAEDSRFVCTIGMDGAMSLSAAFKAAVRSQV